MVIRYFELYELPCGVCGHPAHHGEAFPNGVRTVHMEQQRRPCDSVRSPASSQPGRRGSEPPRVLPRAPAPVRSPLSTDRRSA